MKEEKENILSRSYRLPEETVINRLDKMCDQNGLKKEKIVADAITEKLDKLEEIYGKPI